MILYLLEKIIYTTIVIIIILISSTYFYRIATKYVYTYTHNKFKKPTIIKRVIIKPADLKLLYNNFIRNFIFYSGVYNAQKYLVAGFRSVCQQKIFNLKKKNRD